MRGSEIRNSEQELHQFQVRVGVAGIAVLVAFALLAARFLYLQVLQHDVYRAKAEDNRISVVPVTPNRGLIVDRNGVVVARNYSGYTLEIFPKKVRSLERTIDELTEYVEITNRDRIRFRKLLQETRNAENLPLRNRLSDEEVAKFAANRFRFEGVEIRAYSVIYRALEDLRDAMTGMLRPEEVEETVGTVEVRQTFRASRVGTIAGCYVTDGHVTRGAKVRIVRDGTVIYDTTIASLKRFNDDVREVATGYECGIVLANYQDIKEGDVLEAYETRQVERTDLSEPAPAAAS